MVDFLGFENPELRTPKLLFFQILPYCLPPLRVGRNLFFKKKRALIQSFGLIAINMSTTVVSHSEPILFLTKDQQVQVRAHTTADGSMFFCVSDFIRHMLVEDVSKDYAVELWIEITLCNQQEVSV